MKQYKVGFLCGFFDPLHDGHIDIMQQAKEMCERLIVAVGTDDFMMQRKHHGTILATVYKGNIIKNLIMDCQSYTKYRPNETTGGIFVSWRRKEELPTGA